MLRFRNFIETVDLSKINTTKLLRLAIKDCDWGGGDGDGYRDMAKIELYGDLDHDYNREIERAAVRIAKREMEDKLSELIWMYENFQEPIRLYREITVQGKNFEEVKKNIVLKKIGVSWSWEEASACAHWGNFNTGYKKIILYAEVPSVHVDWECTLILNIHPSLGEEEKEVRLYDGQPITIKKIEYGENGRCGWHDVKLQGLT